MTLYLYLYLHRAVSGERCGLLQILETNRDSGRVGEAAISNSKRVAESKWIGRDKRWLESKSQEISSLIEEPSVWWKGEVKIKSLAGTVWLWREKKGSNQFLLPQMLKTVIESTYQKSQFENQSLSFLLDWIKNWWSTQRLSLLGPQSHF